MLQVVVWHSLLEDSKVNDGIYNVDDNGVNDVVVVVNVMMMVMRMMMVVVLAFMKFLIVTKQLNY